MPSERVSVVKKFTLDGHDFYFHISNWEDGHPGEVWIDGDAKDGTLVGSLLNILATQMSLSLQSGTPFRKVFEKLAGTRFAPSGFTGDPEFPSVSSFADAFAQWARKKFPEEFADGEVEVAAAAGGDPLSSGNTVPTFPNPNYLGVSSSKKARSSLSGPLCPRGCGPMAQVGTCFRCDVCGTDTGGCGA